MYKTAQNVFNLTSVCVFVHKERPVHPVYLTASLLKYHSANAAVWILIIHLSSADISVWVLMAFSAEPNISIVLMGKTGVGKSASGNTILGQEAFNTNASSTSNTQYIQMANVRECGLSIDVYDTPGFFNTNQSNDDVKRKCLVLAQVDEDYPIIFLLVIPISRWTSEDEETISAVQELLGDRCLPFTWILFANGDALQRDKLTVEEFIGAAPKLRRLIQHYSNRYHVFNNKENQSCEQVKNLLEKITNKHQSSPNRTPWYNFILLGKSGDGRSSTGNTILGQRRFISKCSFNSVTLENQMESVVIENVKVDVIDTPGLCNTTMDNSVVLQKYRDLIQGAEFVPTIFLLVIRAQHLTQKDEGTVQKIKNLLGDQFLQNTWILFTHQDKLESQNLTVEDIISESASLRDINRYCVFNNRTQNPDQVKELVYKIRRSSIRIGGLMRVVRTGLYRKSYNFILLGKSGDGRSSTGNTLLGQRRFISKCSFNSVTLETQMESVVIENVKVNVIDTPGLCNATLDNSVVLQKYRDLIQEAESVPTIFLLVIRAQSMTSRDERTVHEIKSLLSDRFLQNTWILFTHQDKLESQNITVEDIIRRSAALRDINRYCVFNNKTQNRDQVNRLINDIMSASLNIRMSSMNI